MYTYAYIYIHIHTYTYIYLHIHTYTYIYTSFLLVNARTDMDTLASASLDRSICMWDPNTFMRKATLKGHTKGVSIENIHWCSDGTF